MSVASPVASTPGHQTPGQKVSAQRVPFRSTEGAMATYWECAIFHSSHHLHVLRFEEHPVRVGTMYGRMAHRAGLVFLGLVMERRSRGGRSVHRERVAFETNQVYVAALQQPRVRRTMRCVASHATLSLDGSVLPGKWPCLVRMAVEANHVLRSSGAQLLRQK